MIEETIGDGVVNLDSAAGALPLDGGVQRLERESECAWLEYCKPGRSCVRRTAASAGRAHCTCGFENWTQQRSTGFNFQGSFKARMRSQFFGMLRLGSQRKLVVGCYVDDGCICGSQVRSPLVS